MNYETAVGYLDTYRPTTEDHISDRIFMRAASGDSGAYKQVMQDRGYRPIYTPAAPNNHYLAPVPVRHEFLTCQKPRGLVVLLALKAELVEVVKQICYFFGVEKDEWAT